MASLSISGCAGFTATCVFLAAAGCSSTTIGTDASAPDVAVGDSGVTFDADTGVPVDAAVELDAGVDASVDAGLADAAPSDAGTSELEIFCEARAQSVCAYRVRCGLADSMASCLELSASADDAQLCLEAETDSVQSGRASFDPIAGEACLTELEHGTTCPTPEPLESLAQCGALFAGRAPLGGGCAIDVECTGQTFCENQSTCPGICTELRQVGDPASEDRECARGSYVFGGRCEVPVALGDSCAPVDTFGYPRCVEGATCDRYGGQTCVAVAGENTACPTGFECAPLLQCTDFGCLRSGLSGSECTRDVPMNDRRRCVPDLFCDALPNGSVGQCATRRGVGEACFERADCKPGMRCLGASKRASGACAAAAALGEVCAPFFDDCAADLFCPLNGASATCQTRKLEGELCSDGAGKECVPGLACLGGRCAQPGCRF